MVIQLKGFTDKGCHTAGALGDSPVQSPRERRKLEMKRACISYLFLNNHHSKTYWLKTTAIYYFSRFLWVRYWEVLSGVVLSWVLSWWCSQMVAGTRSPLGLLYSSGTQTVMIKHLRTETARAPGHLPVCGLSVWPLQHSGFLVAGLLSWWLRVPKAHIARERENSWLKAFCFFTNFV